MEDQRRETCGNPAADHHAHATGPRTGAKSSSRTQAGQGPRPGHAPYQLCYSRWSGCGGFMEPSSHRLRNYLKGRRSRLPAEGIDPAASRYPLGDRKMPRSRDRMRAELRRDRRSIASRLEQARREGRLDAEIRLLEKEGWEALQKELRAQGMSQAEIVRRFPPMRSGRVAGELRALNRRSRANASSKNGHRSPWPQER